MWRINCDGTALATRLSVGAVLVSPSGERHTFTRVYERRGCSNEAEALALIDALSEAARLGATDVRVECDNTILIAQTIGTQRTRIARLATVFAAARAALARFRRVELTWVPRHRNSEADTLARQALGLRPKPAKINQKKKR